MIASAGQPSPYALLNKGREYIQVARRYADRLPLAQRYALWKNCDVRERIYTLAQAEVYGKAARRFMFHQLLRHPWWLRNEAVRSTLLHGATRQVPDDLRRSAA